MVIGRGKAKTYRLVFSIGERRPASLIAISMYGYHISHAKSPEPLGLPGKLGLLAGKKASECCFRLVKSLVGGDEITKVLSAFGFLRFAFQFLDFKESGF